MIQKNTKGIVKMPKSKEFDLQTPCYIIYPEILEKNIKTIQYAFTSAWGSNVSIAYSIKTNHLINFLKQSISLGCMPETVSNDEYKLASDLGVDPSRIIYNGPQKDGEIFSYAVMNGSIINIDNFEDIAFLKSHRETLIPNRCKIGIRVNFDLEKICKGETTAGVEGSRFGICVENGDFRKAVEQIHEMGLFVDGLHMHYSTTTRSLSVFDALAKTASSLIKQYNLEHELTFIDMGGGFFGGRKVAGYPSMDEYAKVITEGLSGISRDRVCLIVEPGASILSTAVEYVCRVINTRDIRGKRVITVDGSMMHINPFFSKRQPLIRIESSNDRLLASQLICGNTCMENDRIMNLENHVELSKGDCLWVENAGAYTMSFNNCFINVPPYIYEYMSDKYTLVRDKNYNIMLQI
jgi:diaminopimelate decarboxylase